MKPFKFIRYFLIDNEENKSFSSKNLLSPEVQDMLLNAQKYEGAYTFLFSRNSFYALYLKEYDIGSIKRDLNLVHKNFVETTYLGQSFFMHKMKVLKNIQGVYDRFLNEFEKCGHNLMGSQYAASLLNTDHYTFQVQYLVHSDQVVPILACQDLIVDKVPMFEQGSDLIELPSELLGNILHSTDRIPDVYEHIVETYGDYDPQNDWSMISIIEFLKKEIETNKGWSKSRVVEQLHKIDTLKGICYRLGLPR